MSSTLDYLIQLAAEKQIAFNKKTEFTYKMLLYEKNAGTQRTPGKHVRIYDFYYLFYESIQEFCIENNIKYEVKYKPLQKFMVIQETDFPQLNNNLVEKCIMNLDEKLTTLESMINMKYNLIEKILLIFGNKLVQGIYIFLQGKRGTPRHEYISISIAADDDKKSSDIMKKIHYLCKSKDVKTLPHSYAGDDDGYPRDLRCDLYIDDISFPKIIDIFTLIKNEFQS